MAMFSTVLSNIVLIYSDQALYKHQYSVYARIYSYNICTRNCLMQDFEIMGKAGKIVRLVRVMRVMRIFKLVRHFAGLQSLIYTLNQAYKELGLLMLLVGVAVLTFASLVMNSNFTLMSQSQFSLFINQSHFFFTNYTLVRRFFHELSPLRAVLNSVRFV